MGQLIELGAFSANLSDVIRQLKHDLKDDWYPDSLGYEDFLQVEVAHDFLLKTFDTNHGEFIPEGRTELNIPKKGFVLRYSLEMSWPDRLYYQALVGQLIPFYDELLPNQVLNHRSATVGKRAGRYTFKHPVEQWHLFRSYVEQEARQKPVILITDIQNFYENLSIVHIIDVLEKNVKNLKASGCEKARLRQIISELNRCLRIWCYSTTHGLPQNRDASSFLASLALLPIDQAMLDEGYAYFRYMDDIRIAVNDKYEAREALQLLTIRLRGFGLNVNALKTRIWEPSDADYEEALGKPEPLLAEIDNLWRSRSLQRIRRSFIGLQKLAQHLIDSDATQDRAFRFCVHKFANLALCPELTVPKAYFDPVTDACISALDSQPFSSDKLVGYLKAVQTSDEQISRVAGLLKDEKRSIYDWQNYLLWQLLVYKKHADADLQVIARKRVGTDKRQADRAGAILYLGALGITGDREFLTQNFRSYQDYIVQRNAIIAVHEIGFNSGIKEYVADHVLASLKGTYKRLREGFFGEYHRPLPSIPAVDLYDEVSSYD